MKKIINYLLALLVMAGSACNKEDFLNAKPNTGIVTPTSLTDLRSMLDNTPVFMWTPGIGEASADNYYMPYTNWQASTEVIRNAYTWQSNVYGSTRNIDDWSKPYAEILYANIVLEQLAKISPAPADQAEWNNQKASALFLRAFAHYNLVAHFAPAYDSSTAQTDLGIPLRFSSDIHALVGRSTVRDCYSKIIADITQAIPQLSTTLLTTSRNRPNQPAAYALLSRICLSARNYDAAQKYADTCISLYNKLVNYNTISTSATTPFDKLNDENLYYAVLVDYDVNLSISTTAYVDTLLYQSYASNDLRKAIYFRTISGTNMGIKRGYSGTINAYSGLAMDEVYLNRAECLARSGNIVGAMNDLNTVLINRWKTGTYTNQTAVSQSDALQKILTERRKELLFRGLRWIDIKRFNKENAGWILTRILNGTTYSLSPNSPLYVLPIPDNEISDSGITQNPR